MESRLRGEFPAKWGGSQLLGRDLEVGNFVIWGARTCMVNGAVPKQQNLAYNAVGPAYRKEIRAEHQPLKHVAAFSDQETRTRCIAFPLDNPITVLQDKQAAECRLLGR
jgi:hypothetical protein